MSTIIYTARRGSLGRALAKNVESFLRDDDSGNVFVIVPNQLTLETEMFLTDELGLKGSFRLNVVSPKRLCDRVFEETGRPVSSVIDERGRAMLMGFLLKQHQNELKWYRTGASKAGFEAQLVKEISNFRQAGISSDEIKDLHSDDMDDRMRAKLNDLSLLYRAYEEKIADVIQDGEQEIIEASVRMRYATSLKDARALVYGFDITTASINQLIAGLAGTCRDVRVYLPLPPKEDGDQSIYEPMHKAIKRLSKVLYNSGVSYTIEQLKDDIALTPVQRAVRSIFTVNKEKIKLAGNEIRARQLKNPLDEAEFVASSIREAVRTKGLKYSDICVVVPEIETHEDVISCAFREYDVPYFSQVSVQADTHPLCRFLNETLALLCGKGNGVSALCETGFTTLNQDEQETLILYCERLKLRPSALLKPFKRGSAEMIDEAEPIRQKLVLPILELKENIQNGSTLRQQLLALNNYLTDNGCFERYTKLVERLSEAGETGLAQDAVRISNLLLDTFDQMDELLGPDKMSISAISDLLERALSSVVVKVLPQSPDAVQICSPQRCSMRPSKYVYLMHAVSSNSGDRAGIFDDIELEMVSDLTGKYIAPSLVDLAKTDRMYLKDALALALDEVTVTFPSGAMDGSALVSGSVISEFKRLIDGFKVMGGVEIDDTTPLRLSSPKGALNYVSGEFSRLEGGDQVVTAVKMLDKNGELSRLIDAARFTGVSEKLPNELARQLYFSGTSISRLERYAACPFSHFVEQGLRPERQRTFQIDPLSRGVLLHECVEKFMKDESNHALSEDEAAERMTEIFDEALKGDIAPYVHDTGASLFQIKELRMAARRAARMLSRQLSTGVFKPVAMETGFGSNGRRFIKLREGLELDGRIDRVDMGTYEGKKYVFVVDYKSGGKKLDPKQIMAGLQLQLLIYLGVALNRYSADSAGVYYFKISDEPVKSESVDTDEIERQRTKNLRMNGIAPDDPKLLRSIADAPDEIINVDFKADGGLKQGAHASSDDFKNLINYALNCSEQFTNEIARGETTASPAYSSGYDACQYCEYASVCLKDRQIGNVKRRKLKNIKFHEMLEQIAPL